MNKNLVAGTTWVDRLDGHHRGFVRIKRVEYGSVTFEINEKINDGADYVMSNWGFTGTVKTLSVEDFEAKYLYSRADNLDHELTVARERMAAAAEMLTTNIDLDLAEAEKLVNLFAKTVLNEASVRIERMDWDTGCCGDDNSIAAGEIEVELTAEEIEELES
jgi:hypothetical protein